MQLLPLATISTKPNTIMNPNIQKHIGSILVALAGIGTELLNKGTATSDETTSPTAEPTTDAPKTRKPRGTSAAAPAETVTVTASPGVIVEPEKKPEPKPVAGAKTWEELKEIARPMVMGQKDPNNDNLWVRQPAGEQLKKIVDKYLPEDRKGQGLKALSEFPQHHGDFSRDVEAFLL